MHDGYCFQWQANYAPILISPSGDVIQLGLSGLVPYLAPEGLACPAAASFVLHSIAYGREWLGGAASA